MQVLPLCPETVAETGEEGTTGLIVAIGGSEAWLTVGEPTGRGVDDLGLEEGGVIRGGAGGRGGDRAVAVCEGGEGRSAKSRRETEEEGRKGMDLRR